MPANFQDLSGQRFVHLVVLDRVGSNKRGLALWRCRCDCGNESIVTTANLKSGNSTTCGCGKRRKAIHGMIHTRLYATWSHLVDRCRNEHNKSFANYGGRGIKVCAEWLNSFEAFRDWALANGYTDKLTIERIDVNGNYCPENCCWASLKEQANNRRNNHKETYNGETHTIAEWAEITGIAVQTIYQRLHRGWTIEQALTTPTKKR